MKAILTTINPPTKAVEELAKRCEVIVIGDKKTPEGWSYEGVDYYDIESQKSLPFHINYYLEENHYARKNLGYLIAMQQGVELIYDTDDDNIPNDNWKEREATTICRAAGLENEWINAYSLFTDEHIWPRGLSLNNIDYKYLSSATPSEYYSPIHQGLADFDPDVDAIYRMSNPRKITRWERNVSYSINGWCPFNSQTTWFFKEAFPLLYLPINVSFRMTDIWRSFVAQKCLWEMGYGVTFHSPAEVYQERNEHNLLNDFKQEIPGYLNNDLIVETLSKLELQSTDVCENMLSCYQAMADVNVIPEMEIRCVKAWIEDVREVGND